MSGRGASGKRGIVHRLRRAGCVFAEEEAALILNDGRDIESLVARRERGEPLAHVLGWVDFGGLTIEVDPGVFVPRPQTIALAEAAAALSPAVAVDLFAGAGAIASVVAARNPGARVVAAELDVTECLRANARRYGFEVVAADVDDGVPIDLEGRVDVLTANVPYVPTDELQYVPHDGEPAAALDGGPDGLDWIRRLVEVAPRWLRPGGTLLTEVAAHQLPHLPRSGHLSAPEVVSDGDQNGVVVSARRVDGGRAGGEPSSGPSSPERPSG
jgi:release factor glutamine methyltransferase